MNSVSTHPTKLFVHSIQLY